MNKKVNYADGELSDANTSEENIFDIPVSETSKETKDELIIEDETTKAESSAHIIEETTSETTTTKIEEPNEELEIESEISDELPEGEDPTPIKKKGKKGFAIVFILILLIIISGIYMYTMQPERLAKWLPVLEEKGLIKTHKEEVAEPAPIQNTDEEQSISNEENVQTDEDMEMEDAQITNEEVTDEEVMDAITEELMQSPTKSTTVTSGKIQPPCWIIGYASISEESKAEKAVAKLTEKGIQAGYYWIPDVQVGGPELYKVYVGPFDTKTSADSELPSVQEIENAAYVMQVK